MRRVALLVVLALALPVAAFADSVTDYAIFGTTSGGTATVSGVPATAGGTISVTSALFAINGVMQPTGGTVSLTTGALTAVSGGFTFTTGGTINITSSSSATLFAGAFTSGSVMVINGVTFINAVGNNVSVTLQIAHGAVSGDTFVTPEPGTLGLLGTGLVGIAGLVRRKFKAA
ncbi:MAG TPA: PEP-CTERM sorting domain-containing protein [Terriglobales bacterium]|nr:PEP-CTERM sorting domain-containing protein [Terriglobales bacterium]